MTTTNLSPEDRWALKAQMMLEQLEAAGLSPEDLLALRNDGEVPGQMPFGEYLVKVRAGAPAGSAHVYGTYWDLFTGGVPHLCGCFCEECLGVFGRFDAAGEPRG